MKKLFKYSQQIILGLVLMTTCVGVVFANIGTFDFSSLTSGFLRKTLGHPPSPGHPHINFFYGYGWSGLNQEWGYGYGYNGSYAVVHGAGVADYGFEGDNGTASVDDISVTQTTATITFSTTYLSQAFLPYSLSPDPQQPYMLALYETDFNSGTRVVNIADLSCGTLYYFAVVNKDASDKSWVGDIHSFTTSSCSSSHGTQVVGGNVNNLTVVPSSPSLKLRLPPITLALGSVGIDVQDLQILLNHIGVFLDNHGAGSSGNETQFFGKKTYAAVKAFQQVFDLKKVDGIYGEETQTAMSKFLN